MLPPLIHKSRNAYIFCLCLLSCGFIIVSLTLPGCGVFDPTERDVALVVGSKRVTISQLKKDLEYFSNDLGLPLSMSEQIFDQLIDRIIDHYLVLEYGREEGIALKDRELETAVKEIKADYPEGTFQEALLRGYVDFEQWKKRLGEMILVDKVMKRVSENVPPPSNQAIKAYFEANRDEFESPPMVRFRQIVVNSKEEAGKLLKRIHDGEKLTDLAKKYSTAPEAGNGGEVGWVAKGQLDESMDEVLFSLREGEVSSVIKTPYGYHIFEVIAVSRGGSRELPEVMSEIEAKLYREDQETYCRKWLSTLRERFDVKINKDLIKTLETS